MKILIITIITFIVTGILLPKLFIKNELGTTWDPLPCSPMDNPIASISTHRDNPIQTLLTLNLAINKREPDKIYATAYTFFGIPTEKIEYTCYGNIKSTWWWKPYR